MTAYRFDVFTAPDNHVFDDVGIEGVFAVMLFQASDRRSASQGSKGLFAEAAAQLVELYSGTFAIKMHARNPAFAWVASDWNKLAVEIAERCKDSLALQEHVARWLDIFRTGLSTDGRLLELNPHLTHYSERERPQDTFTRWIDFIEHSKGTGEYTKVFSHKLKLASCLRVADAVFASS